MDFIVASAKAKVARFEAYIEELSIADDVDEFALDHAYEELEEWVQAHSKPKLVVTFMEKATKDNMSGGWRMRLALTWLFSLNLNYSSSTNLLTIWISAQSFG